MEHTRRWVVVVRPMLPRTGSPDGRGGYWAGPADPDYYATCLSSINMLTGGIDYSDVATFTNPGTAWRIWMQHRRHLGRGWIREFHRLDRITDWGMLPPRITSQAHRHRRGLR